MAEARASQWQPRGAWQGIALPGRHGRAEGRAGVRVTPREGMALASIVARDGDAVVRALSSFLGVPVTDARRCTAGPGGALVGAGPGQWLFVGTTPDSVAKMTDALAGSAAVFEQTGGRAILSLSGEHARDVLAKGCPLDLHPRAFKAGDAAVTAIAHIGVILWQTGDTPAYELAAPRSMAGSFWSWLLASSAAYGCDIAAAEWAQR